MALLNTYVENIEDDSTTTFGFAPDGGGATAIYDTYGVETITDLNNCVIDLIGYTQCAAGSTQRLTRFLPATHPAFSRMYCGKIGGMTGKGSGNSELGGYSLVDAVLPPVTGAPEAIADQFALYNLYRLKMDFQTRNYNILPDELVNINSSGWYPPGSTGSPTGFTYAAEWMRYTDFDNKPQNNTIQAQQGSFIFNSTENPPGMAMFTSPPWMRLPDSITKIQFYQVPLRLITSLNSYIASPFMLGRINQNAFWNYPAGSMLYLDYDYKKYNSPIGETEVVTDLNGNTWTQYAKLCDITFIFLNTARYIQAGSVGTPLTDKNYIFFGHNLQPFFYKNRGFYPVSSPADGTTGIDAGGAAPWRSAPFELLFSDCDVATVSLS